MGADNNSVLNSEGAVSLWSGKEGKGRQRLGTVGRIHNLRNNEMHEREGDITLHRIELAEQGRNGREMWSIN